MRCPPVQYDTAPDVAWNLSDCRTWVVVEPAPLGWTDDQYGWLQRLGGFVYWAARQTGERDSLPSMHGDQRGLGYARRRGAATYEFCEKLHN